MSRSNARPARLTATQETLARGALFAAHIATNLLGLAAQRTHWNRTVSDEDGRARLRAGRVGFVFQSFQLLAGLHLHRHEDLGDLVLD